MLPRRRGASTSARFFAPKFQDLIQKSSHASPGIINVELAKKIPKNNEECKVPDIKALNSKFKPDVISTAEGELGQRDEYEYLDNLMIDEESHANIPAAKLSKSNHVRNRKKFQTDKVTPEEATSLE